MNLLTNYLDRKYNRTHNYGRQKTRLVPTCSDIYFTVRQPTKRIKGFPEDIPDYLPILLISPSMIELKDMPLSRGLKKLVLETPNNLVETLVVPNPEVYQPLCKDSIQEAIPLVVMSIDDCVEGMQHLPEIEEEEEVFEIEFI